MIASSSARHGPLTRPGRSTCEACGEAEAAGAWVVSQTRGRAGRTPRAARGGDASRRRRSGAKYARSEAGRGDTPHLPSPWRPQPPRPPSPCSTGACTASRCACRPGTPPRRASSWTWPGHRRSSRRRGAGCGPPRRTTGCPSTRRPRTRRRRRRTARRRRPRPRTRAWRGGCFARPVGPPFWRESHGGGAALRGTEWVGRAHVMRVWGWQHSIKSSPTHHLRGGGQRENASACIFGVQCGAPFPAPLSSPPTTGTCLSRVHPAGRQGSAAVPH